LSIKVNQITAIFLINLGECKQEFSTDSSVDRICKKKKKVLNDMPFSIISVTNV